MTPSGEQCFSGGLDSFIHWWTSELQHRPLMTTYGTNKQHNTHLQQQQQYSNSTHQTDPYDTLVPHKQQQTHTNNTPVKHQQHTSTDLIDTYGTHNNNNTHQQHTSKTQQHTSTDPYDTYDASVLAGSWAGHSDAVWVWPSAESRTVCCRVLADGTVKLWNPQERQPCVCTFNTDREHGTPTSVDFNGTDPAHMVASFSSGDVVLYDLETSQSALVLKGQGQSGDHMIRTPPTSL
ncbi:hypothetical protein WMY93_033562 [Mugilogobius chulae]|uniref:Uncharacterized protein n=1 Tax=Mugilogobius chulae TaxID=88201 RepID=A0AAW0MNJ4_9GOBI